MTSFGCRLTSAPLTIRHL